MASNATSPGWHLPPGYQSRARPEYFDDAPNLDGVVVHQPDVYGLAECLVAATGRQTVLDIGCGSARKLLALEAPRRIGVDFEANIKTCRAHSPSGTWIEVDLENGTLPAIPEFDPKDAIVINSDVIEHLIDPSNLIAMLAKLYEAGAIVLLSTPDRPRARGADHMGPPGNSAHVREWALPELAALLAWRGLPAVFSGYTLNNTRRYLRNTILTVHDKALMAAKTGGGASARVLAKPRSGDLAAWQRQHLTEHGIECLVAHAATHDVAQDAAHGDWAIALHEGEVVLSPWPELSVPVALAMVSALGYGSVRFSPFLTAEREPVSRLPARGQFSRVSETARARTVALCIGASRESRIFPYCFPSIVYDADFAMEPKQQGRTFKATVRQAITSISAGPGEEVNPASFYEDFLAERLSDVAARRAGFLARLGA